MFAIKCTKGKECGSYVAIDHGSGGYPYWSSRMADAKLFNTKKEAISYVANDLFTESDVMSDGTEFPPYMIHSASGVNCETTKREYEISIVEIAETVVDVPLSGTAEIKYNAY